MVTSSLKALAVVEAGLVLASEVVEVGVILASEAMEVAWAWTWTLAAEVRGWPASAPSELLEALAYASDWGP